MSVPLVARDSNPFEQICSVGQEMLARGFVSATEGNLSVRLEDGGILITPCGACKGRLAPENLIRVDASGRKISGEGEPSTELGMHLLFYARRANVHAVCHAHPPAATGFAVAHIPLDQAILSEAVVTLGAVPLAEYGLPGTCELAASLEPLVPRHDAILLANHGVVTCGPDLRTAFHRMESVEHLARVALVARLLGGPILFTRAEVNALLASRCRYHVDSPPGAPPPLAAEDVSPEAQPSGEIVTLKRSELEAIIAEAFSRLQLD